MGAHAGAEMKSFGAIRPSTDGTRYGPRAFREA